MLQRTNIFTMLHLSDNNIRYSKSKSCPCACHADICSGIPRNFVQGVSTNSVEDTGQRERGSGGSSPLVKCSRGSCNLVKEISFHTVTFS